MMKAMVALAFVSLTATSGLVFAQAAKAKAPAAAAAPASGSGGDNVQYKAKTVFDFEDDMVEGDLQRPDGELVDVDRKAKHSSLIEIRKDFIPEMLKSLEDV